MGRLAVVFAGQGAQSPGMGQSLYETSPAARGLLDTFEQLRPGTLAQCFEGSAETLAQTRNTQPCLCAVDLACAAALSQFNPNIEGAAGFSLGELPALAFTKRLTATEVFGLSVQRGELMQACAAQAPGTMAAVLRLSDYQVITLCRKVRGVRAVNFNAPGQVVIAGGPESIQKFMVLAAPLQARVLPLNVSGAFHSPAMAPAAAAFHLVLRTVRFKPGQIPLYANTTAKPYGSRPAATLAMQIRRPVLWRQTLEQMASDGFDAFIECGPGQVLSNLIRKTLPQARVYAVSDAASLENTAKSLKEDGYA